MTGEPLNRPQLEAEYVSTDTQLQETITEAVPGAGNGVAGQRTRMRTSMTPSRCVAAGPMSEYTRLTRNV
jgi:hypothetical protein